MTDSEKTQATTADTPDAGETRPQGDEASALQRELAELKDRNLRLMAEMRNVQTRLQRDKEESLRYAEADFARELLVILDDLERTLDSGRDASDVAPLREGVRIVLEHFESLLRKRGIERIEATGAAFDPELHEALLRAPSDSVPAGHVVQELARGYRMHSRVLRHARVSVSSGPSPDASTSTT